MHPILFEFGPVTLKSYGVFVALGFFVAFSLLYGEARRKNFYPNKIVDLELVILAFGIIGARLLHVLVNFDFYGKNLLDILFVWKGGLAFYGGFILAILAAWVFILKNRMPLWKTADFIAPYMALGHAIGRIGCFLNGCCFGKPASAYLPGVIFPGEAIYRHPTQLYSSFALLVIFVILKLVQNRPHFAGSVFALYLLLYSTARFLIDFLRGDNPLYAFGLTTSQLICIPVFAFSALLLFFLPKKKSS